MEEPQKPILKPLPLGSLPATPSPNPMHVMPTPAAHETPETPTIKATPAALLMQNFRKLVAFVQTFVTTSKTMATAHTAWHSGWFGCWFRCEAPGPQHFYKIHQFQASAASKGLRNWLWGGGGGGGGVGFQSPPLSALIFLLLF